MTNYPLWVLQQLVVQEHIGIEEMYDVTIHVFGVALVQTLTKYLHSSSYDCKPPHAYSEVENIVILVY